MCVCVYGCVHLCVYVYVCMCVCIKHEIRVTTNISPQREHLANVYLANVYLVDTCVQCILRRLPIGPVHSSGTSGQGVVQQHVYLFVREQDTVIQYIPDISDISSDISDISSVDIRLRIWTYVYILHDYA